MILAAALWFVWVVLSVESWKRHVAELHAATECRRLQHDWLRGVWADVELCIYPPRRDGGTL